MTLTVHDKIEQGTEEWHALRRGIVTASTVGRLLSFESPSAVNVDCPKCKAAAGAPCLSLSRKTPTPISTYHSERAERASSLPPELTIADNETSRGLTAVLAAERVAGWTEDLPMTSDMWRGVDAEPYARAVYAQHYSPVEEVGFMVRDDWGFPIGYSPDGLVGDVGLIEVKAPRAKGHLNTVLADEVPPGYMAQLQCGLLVSGRAWIDFIYYVAGLPLWVKRVHPDPMWQAAIPAAVAKFEATAAEMVATYSERTKGLPPTERIDFNNVELKLA